MGTTQQLHDTLAELRRFCGDETAFALVRVALATARRWKEEPHLARLVGLSEDLKATAPDAVAAMRAACGEYSRRTGKITDPVGSLLALVSERPGLLEVLDQERRALDTLLRELRQPVPGPTAGAVR